MTLDFQRRLAFFLSEVVGVACVIVVNRYTGKLWLTLLVAGAQSLIFGLACWHQQSEDRDRYEPQIEVYTRIIDRLEREEEDEELAMRR